MNEFAMAVVLAMVKRGDILRITPNDRLPNLPRKITVDWVNNGSFTYGCSPHCDGYSYPFWAIKNIKIAGHDDSI